jgi:ubiquinone/menaquinone biosynthesis C-methylase UbiE
MRFKDHFSERAAIYAAYRPLYPEALFEFVAGLTREHRTVLDCGTGNGQAALALAAHFDRVIATDPSAEQISHAVPHDRIEYRVARAESTGLPAQSVDLVTAAQALHWFDAKLFFEEAKRVLVPDGAIAIWGYGDPILDTAPLDQTLRTFNRELLEPYWSPERKLLLDGYRAVPFPFDEVAVPRLELEMRWTLPELAGFLRTWSSAARYVAEHGVDPVLGVEKSLGACWGVPATARVIRWPLYLRAGKIPIAGRVTRNRGS